MSEPLIPASPSADDYRAQLSRAHAAHADEAMFAATDPFALFEAWFAQARASEPNDPNAMALSTVDDQGLPDSRMVLLKDVDPRGFTFYSNGESAKGGQLAVAPRAALLFHWKSLRRQVRVRGDVQAVSRAEADAYFASRARDSRIGAWASDQSRPLADRETLETRIREFQTRFEGHEVPRPPRWRGWRVIPVAIEFWRDRPFRLHDRLLFTREGDGEWATTRLYP